MYRRILFSAAAVLVRFTGQVYCESGGPTTAVATLSTRDNNTDFTFTVFETAITSTIFRDGPKPATAGGPMLDPMWDDRPATATAMPISPYYESHPKYPEDEVTTVACPSGSTCNAARRNGGSGG